MGQIRDKLEILYSFPSNFKIVVHFGSENYFPSIYLKHYYSNFRHSGHFSRISYSFPYLFIHFFFYFSLPFYFSIFFFTPSLTARGSLCKGDNGINRYIALTFDSVIVRNKMVM